MEELRIAQDNRLTTSRYELSVLEKRILYFIIKEVRNQFVVKEGQKDLFDDLIVKIKTKPLQKSINEFHISKLKKALRTLRTRSFEWTNKVSEEDEENHRWFEVGFINYGDYKAGNIEVQLSKKILPFLVELSRSFTEYSLTVAISLKSKWSQRMYEICSQWKHSGGINLNVTELKQMFLLEDKYKKYGAFKKYVIDIAHKELKELYTKGQCDLYFEYSEIKEGRKIEYLKLKIIKSDDKNNITASLEDKMYFLRIELKKIFETDLKPRNKNFIDLVMSNLILEPELLNHCYEKVQYTLKNKSKSEHQKYLRAIFKAEYI